MIYEMISTTLGVGSAEIRRQGKMRCIIIFLICDIKNTTL